MLNQIVFFLLEIVIGLLTGACLLRLYMQHQRISLSARSGNPLGQFILALTDWLVLPLRRVVPVLGRWDSASLVAALLLQLFKVVIFTVLAQKALSVLVLLLACVFSLLSTIVSGLIWLVLAYAILSWLPNRSPVSDLLDRLLSPILAPIRNSIPTIGGVDLSALVLLVILQVVNLVLPNLQHSVFQLIQ